MENGIIILSLSLLRATLLVGPAVRDLLEVVLVDNEVGHEGAEPADPHHAVAHLPVGDPLGDILNLAGKLQAGGELGLGGGIVEPKN